MQPISLQIDAKTFTAVSMFAAKGDIRHYLNGVLVETGANGAYLVGCNGHCLAVHKIDDEPRQDAQVIIPAATVQMVAKIKKGTLSIDLGDVSGKFIDVKRKGEVRSMAGNFLFEEIDGTFPDWRRVAKHTPDPSIVFYHPDYVELVNDAAQTIYKRKLPALIRPGGQGCGFATLDTDGRTCAWIMPLRGTVDELATHPGFTI